MPSPETFHQSLIEYGVPQELIARIDQGFEGLVTKSAKSVKARFFRQALALMENELGPEKTREIFEANACCKSGARLKASRAFARLHAGLPLEDKLEMIRRAPDMRMGAPHLTENGDIVIDAVRFQVGDKFACACPSISRQKIQPESKDYCYCCAGHFRFHYEIMLDCKLSVAEIVSSPLDSAGREPCVIRLSVCGE